MLPVTYSADLVMYWFGNAGILIPGFFFHFYFIFSGLSEKVPNVIYPWIFYLPVGFVAATYLTGTNIINNEEFVQTGYWIYPVFNDSYLMTLTAANVVSVLIVFLLVYSLLKSRTKAEAKLYKVLLFVASLVLIWDVVFGYWEFRGVLPPHPYIFAGLFWAGALFYAMNRLDFMERYDRRYELLYQRNRTAILFVKRDGVIHSANPSAEQLLEKKGLEGSFFTSFLAWMRECGRAWILMQPLEAGV